MTGKLTSADIEVLAEAIHGTWRALSREEGWSMQPYLNKPYAELEETDKLRAAFPQSWRWSV